MPERALKCPQCNAPLTASRFSRSAVCPFCGTTVLLDEQAVSAERFREAYREWNAPERVAAGGVLEIAGAFWAQGRLLARGERADVYRVTRARWPTEQALLKVLRDRRESALFDHEWEVLTKLQGSPAPGAAALLQRLPQPIAQGEITSGPHSGSRAMLLRWESGYEHTFDDVRAAYPQGIPARASIWIWRRVLETLAFLHGEGLVHGGVLPQHLLVERGEHGVQLVGFSAAGASGGPLATVCEDRAGFYPAAALAELRVTPAMDLAMSARVVAMLLGAGNGQGVAPEEIVPGVADDAPEPLAALLAEVAGWPQPDTGAADRRPQREAWTLREELGELASSIYGAPVFCPITMPGEHREG
jgi:hypothetical protein